LAGAVVVGLAGAFIGRAFSGVMVSPPTNDGAATKKEGASALSSILI
jgi:hypothetical protein